MAAIVDEKAAALETPAVEAPVRPNWREQPYTWFLAGLVVTNVALDALFFKVIEGEDSTFAVGGYGMLLGQLFLMGLWLAYGGLHFVARLLAVAASTAAGTAVVCLVSGTTDTPMLAAMSAMMVAVAFALLLPLRTLLGWRIDFDPAYHARSPNRAMQLRLANIVAYTAVCAVPCALLQAVGGASDAATMLLLYALVLMSSLPVVWMMVAVRRTARSWFFSICVLLASLTLTLAVPKDTFPVESAFTLEIGGIAIVAMNVGLLRFLFGLRLFSVLGPLPDEVAPARSSTVYAELAYLAIVWPQLPAAIRNELFDQVRAATRKE